jgi:hypothetical protein
MRNFLMMFGTLLLLAPIAGAQTHESITVHVVDVPVYVAKALLRVEKSIGFAKVAFTIPDGK